MRSRIVRSASLVLALLALAIALPATALGLVRFDREWKVAGISGSESGIAIDGTGGTVYVADPFTGASGRIVVYDRDGRQLRTLERATGVDVERPVGLAVDSIGNLLVFEGDLNRVRVMTPTGTPVRTIAPTGTAAFDDLAQGIAVDAADNLYVADTRASRIEVFDPAGNLLRAIPLGGQFVNDVAVDAAGNVYALLIFGDGGCGSAVQVHAPSGALVSRWAATQDPVFSCARSGIAIDPRTGEVLVSTQSGSSPGVRRYTPAGVLVGAPLTGKDSSADRLQAVGLAVDAAGTVFVRDTAAARILRFADLPPAPNLQTTIPSPRTIGVGPATVVAPGRISLGSLRRSKCVRTLVLSTKRARVTVRIFSGIRSLRLFGAKTVRFTGAGRKVVCIPVPFRAKSFDARTRLRISVAVALGPGSSGGPAPPAPKPKTRPISLVP